MKAAALWLYRLLTVAALPILAPWLLFLSLHRRKGSPRLRQRLGFGLPDVPTGGIWIQAVSVGEVAAARSILVELRRRRPDLPLVLSATTATGLALAAAQKLAHGVLPFPIDLPGPVRRMLKHVQPRAVMLIETELWPETLHQCEQRGIPVILANARISDHSFRRYRRVRCLLRVLLRPITKVLAQEDIDLQRLEVLGVDRNRITVAGNVKFDIPLPSAAPLLAKQLRELARGRPVWIAGSTVPGEEPMVLDALNHLPPERRPLLLLAPRHPERAQNVQECVMNRGLTVVRRTVIETAGEQPDVVLLDTVGELAALYGIAFAAYVGGSLVAAGGHNPIEAARFGVPVLAGPHVQNFAAVYRRFLDAGAAVQVHDSEELAAVLCRWLDEPTMPRDIGDAGQRLLEANAGATARIVDTLEAYLA